ncbi:MAG: hypothetical protein PHF50_03555 [Patescibacteria group bacterium]|nr:hypothetical protein [Patescibacteria group bacterium]
MKKLFRKIKINKKYFLLGLFILAVVVFIFPQIVNAAESNLGSTIANSIKFSVASPILLALGVIASLIIVIFGALNTIIISALVNIVQYNNFINEPSIRDAWVVARDLCNMFFILILLVISFATILRLPNYEWKKILPKLLIMAVLINFSRTICGLIIDASQIIMLTFVNAWAAGGNFVNMLSMAKFFTGVTFNNITTAEWSILNVVAGMLIGIMFLIICGIVLIVTLAVFLMRVIMLWIYIVLSPFAFLAAAFPAGQKYATQWWSEFVKYIINGPVLAFFIWLALITSKQITDNGVFFNNTANANQCFGLVEGMCMNNFLPFIISIGMLLGGLMITQQIGGVGSSIAGKGLDWAKKIGGAPLAAGAWGSKALLFKAGRMLDTGQMKVQKWAGLEFPKSMNYRMIASGWKADRAKKMADYESGVLTKTGPLHTMWQETFNKYLEVKQYGAVRKSRAQRESEVKKKKALETENLALENDIKSGRLSPAYKAGAEKRIAENKEQIRKYEDVRKGGIGLISAERARPYDFVLSKSGDKEREDKEKRAMELRTQQRSFAVNNELIKAFHEKDNDKLVSALKILTQNNDLNEGLKDKRIIDLMTRENGILDKMAKKGQLGELGKGGEFDNNLKVLKEDFSANPVTPAHAQAMVRGMLEEMGVSEKKAARTSNDIGEVSFASGAGLLFGSALGNAETGEFEFEKLNFKDGKLQTSTTKKAAIAAKYTNLEAQQKMKTLHPDIFIAENSDGDGTRLTEDGAYFLEYSLNGNDLTQLSRLRSDLVKKISKSQGVLKGIKELVDKLEKDGKAEQANNVKYFTGYLVGKMKGKALTNEKEFLDVYNQDIKTS